MTPLLACFPVCLTFVGIGILAVLVFVTGMVGPVASAAGNETCCVRSTAHVPHV